MVEIPANPPAKTADAGQDDEEIFQPQIGIEVQFIKDLSFENPIGSNATAMMTQTPEVNVEVATNARPLEEGQYEVSIIIRGEAKTSESTVFIVELTYAGVLTISNAPKDAIGPILLIEGARLLFPFARNIVADVTRDGGFPPLLINPIDFAQLYRDQHMTEESTNGVSPN